MRHRAARRLAIYSAAPLALRFRSRQAVTGFSRSGRTAFLETKKGRWEGSRSGARGPRLQPVPTTAWKGGGSGPTRVFAPSRTSPPAGAIRRYGWPFNLDDSASAASPQRPVRKKGAADHRQGAGRSNKRLPSGFEPGPARGACGRITTRNKSRTHKVRIERQKLVGSLSAAPAPRSRTFLNR